MEMNGTVYIHNNIRHQYHEILQHFNININTYLNSNTEQPFYTILKPEYFLTTLQIVTSIPISTPWPSPSSFAKKLDFVQKIGISAKKLDFSKKPGFQGHFSWISSWAPTGGWNCKKVGFQTPVKTSFFARNPYFLHEIQVFCKTRW